jgi:glycosyltransferase involved in cell wall biosynthesis
VVARRNLLKKISPDYVHVLNPFIKAYSALRYSGQKIVGDWDEWPAHRNLPLPRLIMEKFLDRWLRKRSQRLVVASKYLQQQFKQRFNLDAAYIPYATYLQPWGDGNTPFAEPTAVYMGNLYPAYDHDLLFEAARLLKARGRAPRIAILGAGPDTEKWCAFVAAHGLTNVSVPGFVSGELLWRHLRHAHVLLFPIRENLLNLCRCPSKTFAYAQSRRPTIANRVGEVAQVLGDRGIYVDCTSEAFADAIDAAMSAPARPDINYRIEDQNWSARTDALLKTIGVC